MNTDQGQTCEQCGKVGSRMAWFDGCCSIQCREMRNTRQLEVENEKMRDALTEADACIARQRQVFAAWSDMMQAVMTMADIQALPPESHTQRDLGRWQAGLTDAEKDAVSAALDAADFRSQSRRDEKDGE
jgi:hypothetical protein